MNLETKEKVSTNQEMFDEISKELKWINKPEFDIKDNKGNVICKFAKEEFKEMKQVSYIFEFPNGEYYEYIANKKPSGALAFKGFVQGGVLHEDIKAFYHKNLISILSKGSLDEKTNEMITDNANRKKSSNTVKYIIEQNKKSAIANKPTYNLGDISTSMK